MIANIRINTNDEKLLIKVKKILERKLDHVDTEDYSEEEGAECFLFKFQYREPKSREAQMTEAAIGG